MLENLLKFNPEKRLTVRDCLSLPFFEDIRVKELEREAPYRIYLGCDEGPESGNLDLKQMQDIIM